MANGRFASVPATRIAGPNGRARTWMAATEDHVKIICKQQHTAPANVDTSAPALPTNLLSPNTSIQLNTLASHPRI